jgi:hypothetical protein
MVDEDWWMGTNSKGESGLFPSNYVELVEEDEAPAPAAHVPEPSAPPTAPRPAAAPAASSGPTATAIYDYEAAEDNELSFDEGATVTGLVSIPNVIKPCFLLTLCRNFRMKIGGLVISEENQVSSRPIMYNLMNECSAVHRFAGFKWAD